MRYFLILLVVIGVGGAAVAPAEAADPFCKNGKLKKDKCK